MLLLMLPLMLVAWGCDYMCFANLVQQFASSSIWHSTERYGAAQAVWRRPIIDLTPHYLTTLSDLQQTQRRRRFLPQREKLSTTMAAIATIAGCFFESRQ